MRLAKLFWTIGSVLINVVLGIYIYLSSNAPKDKEERLQYLHENWDMYEAHWKAEFLIMALITIGALYFALNTRKVSWTMVSVGQIILLFTYPIMLGGYRNTPLEIFEMANAMATVVFIFGNVVLFGGLFILYLKDVYLKQWVKVLAYSIAGFMTLVFMVIFAGFITWGQALIFAPLANIIYFINAYYGLKIRLESKV